MEIYVVQQGDTIESVASKFGITVERLIVENGMQEYDDLVVGQTLVITYPTQTYVIKEGDTLDGIAELHQISIMQLLRNNPHLAHREYLYAGESLVIRYDNNNGTLLIDGYSYSFINDQVLTMTLPYLSNLLILNYRTNSNGDFTGSDKDLSVIQTALLYDTSSSFVITAYSDTGTIDTAVIQDVLLNPQVQETSIDNILQILRTKGYHSVNLAFQLVNEENQYYYLGYLERIYSRLHVEGYSVYLTLNPGLYFNNNELTFQKINYTEFSRVSDGILFLSYDWGSIQRPPTQFSIITEPQLLEYIINQVPLDKIRVGLPTFGYNWKLPYVTGISKANALNYSSVLRLARETNSVIHYDETLLSAYFNYLDEDRLEHIVWFKDARSIDSAIKILKSYGINGIGIWNIMYYFDQLWLVINTQYEIVKGLDL